VVYSAAHRAHAPRWEVDLGQVLAQYEVPDRAEVDLPPGRMRPMRRRVDHLHGPESRAARAHAPRRHLPGDPDRGSSEARYAVVEAQLVDLPSWEER